MTLTPQIWLFIVFGILGVFGEVFFTALIGLFKSRKWRLNGESYIWMFPIYGLIALLFDPLYQQIEGLGWFARGLVYLIVIWVVEFITGTLLTKLTGGHIWQYTGRFQYKGQIHFLYAPVWFTIGLLVEKFYNDLEQLALWLSLHF